MSPDPISTEEYFRGTLKVIAHWSEVDLSGEWETGLRGVIRSITDMAREVLSAHPEKPAGCSPCSWPACGCQYNPGAAKAEPSTVAADLDGGDARPNRRLDSSDRGHTFHAAQPAPNKELLASLLLAGWKLGETPLQIVDRILDCLAAQPPAAPVGMDWKLSDDAKQTIAEIDRNIREAPASIANHSRLSAENEHSAAVSRVIWRHKKRGTTYQVVTHFAALQCASDPEMEDRFKDLNWTIYRSREDGAVYIRLTSEFMDGRFERIGTDGVIPAVPQEVPELRQWQDSSEFYRKDLKDVFDVASDLYAAFVQVKTPTNGQREALDRWAEISNALVHREGGK